MIAQHMDEIAVDAAQPEPQLHPQDESMGPPVELVPDKDAHSFHLRTSASELIKQVLSAYGITPTIDSSVANGLARMDVADVNFKDAARMVRMVTGTFFVPLDPKRVLVAKDTKENRARYQRLAYGYGLLPRPQQRRDHRHGPHRAQRLPGARRHRFGGGFHALHPCAAAGTCSSERNDRRNAGRQQRDSARCPALQHC